MTRKKEKQKSNGNNIQISIFDFITDDVSKEDFSLDSNKQLAVVDEFRNELDNGELHQQLNRTSERVQKQSFDGLKQHVSDNPIVLVREDNSHRPEITNGKRADVGLDKQTDHVVKNYQIDITDDAKMSADIKLQRNLQALELLRLFDNEHRKANDEEQQVLAGYSGWGGLPQIFDERNAKYAEERYQIKELLTVDEYKNAKASVLTSFYTPYSLIDKVYTILGKLGFEKGKILEPSVGTGGFFGMLPQSMQESALYGVELDSISGKIAKQLYPKANINITGFEETTVLDDYFDLAIGNVPFGNYKVHDIEYNKYNYNIHNYFIMKSLDKVRDGGLLAFITTTETMDGKSSIMEELSKKANLVTAYRLPANTFMLNGANTEVTSDIVILQKVDKQLTSEQPIWTRTKEFGHRRVNEYFVEHPNHILGELYEKTNQYGKPELSVRATSDIHDLLEELLYELPEGLYLEHTPEVVISTHEFPLEPHQLNYKENEFFIEEDTLFVREGNIRRAIQDTKINVERIKGMVHLSALGNDLIDLQLKNASDHAFNEKQHSFNERYDAFVKKYGYLGTRTNRKLFENDPRFYFIISLESVDADTREVHKSDFFTSRTIKPQKEIKQVENVLDALNATLNSKGVLDFDYMSVLYMKPVDTIIKELEESNKIFYDPFHNEYVLDDIFLSGNVRSKLKDFKNQRSQDVAYARHVEALEKVVPEWINADEIKAQLGAPFVPEKYVKDFACEVFKFDDGTYRGRSSRNNLDISYIKQTGEWVFSAWSERYDRNVTQSWGVETDTKLSTHFSQPLYNGFQLFDDTLNSRVATIYDYYYENRGDEKKKRRVNPTRTALARELQERLSNEFEAWLFSDLDRRTCIEELYNHTFNSHRTREYDGSYLTFPTMNALIQMEPYQKNAIARIVSGQNTLLSQVVGAGKTYEMIAGGMEMKRLGLKNKIMYVVPNHLVDQWGSDFKKLYPSANTLVTTRKDFEKKKRNEFIHKIATNHYDAVILAHSSFKLIPISKEYQVKHLEEEISQITIAIEEFRRKDTIYSSYNTKQIKTLERTKKSIEANMRKLVDIKRDEGITLDKMGIDYLMVDEAHEFKNLYVYSQMSNIAGVPQVKSEKASDMFMKTQYIKEAGGGVCFATGTPISNTMAELYTMQRYLQNDKLKEIGIHCFDAWAKTFGKVVNSIEIGVDGNSFRSRLRFNKFYNVAELMNVFRDVAEILTKPMLENELKNSKLNRSNAIPPKHIGGKPKVVSILPSEELENYMSKVVERTEAIHNGSVEPYKDNMLKVTGDSKRASIDLRLIQSAYGHIANTKLDYVVREIQSIYREYDTQKATQLVFCDFSAPNSERFNVYDEIKDNLIAIGIPAEEIAYIHDAKTELQKNSLFKKMNNGTIRVLLGSTAKLGAGTNVQERLIAIHHVDVPWRASDVEQRNGRGFRQGNMFEEIYEIRYATTKSFDAYSWQMIETKSTYMRQLLEGSTTLREMVEDNDAILSYAEVKAIASGNPLIKEKLEVDNRIQKLELLKQQFLKSKFSAESEIKHIPSLIKKQENILRMMYPDLEVAKENRYPENAIEDKFQIQLFGKNFTNMKEAGDYLNEELTSFNKITSQEQMVGTYLSFGVGLKYDPDAGWRFYMIGKNKSYRGEIVHQVGRVNFVRMLKIVSSIEHDYEVEQTYLYTFNSNYKQLEDTIRKHFEHEDELKELRNKQKEIDQALNLNEVDKVDELEVEEVECEEIEQDI